MAAGEADVTVRVGESRFDPAELTIPAGTTVTWHYEGVAAHTVTAEDDLFDSGQLVNGDSFSFTFDEPGEYLYFCQFHGSPDGRGMAGLVIVTAP